MLALLSGEKSLINASLNSKNSFLKTLDFIGSAIFLQRDG